METTLQENPAWQVLYDGNLEFKKIFNEYLELKKEALELSKHLSLNESESEKLHQLKVRKLHLKEKLDGMLQEN